jgi:hypothetical protein
MEPTSFCGKAGATNARESMCSRPTDASRAVPQAPRAAGPPFAASFNWPQLGFWRVTTARWPASIGRRRGPAFALSSRRTVQVWALHEALDFLRGQWPKKAWESPSFERAQGSASATSAARHWPRSVCAQPVVSKAYPRRDCACRRHGCAFQFPPELRRGKHGARGLCAPWFPGREPPDGS